VLASPPIKTTTPNADPELLIEEARQRQRDRRRALLRIAMVAVIGLTIGIAQFARGGGGTTRSQPPTTAAAISSRGSVIYEKLELIVSLPDRPTVRTIVRTWVDSDQPTGWRETIAGRPSLEYGQQFVSDPLIGRELVTYFYDGQTKRMYQTGAFLGHPSPGAILVQVFRHYVRLKSVHRATRIYDGRAVDAFTLSDTVLSHQARTHVPVLVLYLDAHTHVPVFYSAPSGGQVGTPSLIERALAWKILPATPANLRLASLTTSHPGARVVPEGLAHIAGSVYNSQPQHVRGLDPAVESSPVVPLLWAMLYGGVGGIPVPSPSP
jgi:hypothetical protein